MAVLSVVSYHLGLPLIDGGFVGVDIFFVISGFLITTRIVKSIDAGTFSFNEFYLARIRRILPAMIVTTLLSLAAGGVLMAPGALQEMAGSAIAAIASVSNIYFWFDSGYFAADESTRVLLHTWSLGVEEQFYLFWPLLLVAVSTLGRNLTVLSVIIVSAASLVAAEIALGLSPSSAFYLMPFRVCEFGLGAVLAMPLRHPRVAGSVAEAGTLLGIAVMVGAVFMIDSGMRFPGVLAMVPCFGAAMAIAFGAQSRVAQLALANPAATAVGRISYSLYLVHWPLVVLTEYALSRELDQVEALVVFAVCMVLAYAMYAWVEQPFRQKRGGAFLVQTRPLLLSTACMAIVAVVLAWNASGTGWIWRLGDRASIFDGVSDPRQFHVNYFGGQACSLPRCETNPAAGRVAYLIGDSHARAYYAGLKAVFPEVNFVIYGPNACPMYSVTMSHYDEHTEACVKARTQAFDELSTAKGPVFMTHHWAARMESAHRAKADDAPIEFGGDFDRFAKFVIAEVGQVERRTGRKVILIGGVPRYGGAGSPFDCVSRPIQPQDCAESPKTGYVAVQQFFTRAVRSSGVVVIDPYDVLCDQTSCKDIDDTGRSMYSDRTHLSIWGSQFVVQGMKAALSPYLD